MHTVYMSLKGDKMEIAGRNYSSAGLLCALLIWFSTNLTWQFELLGPLRKQGMDCMGGTVYGSPYPCLDRPNIKKGNIFSQNLPPPKIF